MHIRSIATISEIQIHNKFFLNMYLNITSNPKSPNATGTNIITPKKLQPPLLFNKNLLITITNKLNTIPQTQGVRI